jgi:hypothetical protein
MTTLTDPVQIEVPGRTPVQPAAPLDPPRETAPESRPTKRSFDLESRGGYSRTVVGTVAYLDDEAQTYMVRTDAGKLVRVPLREITSEHDSSPRSRL